MRSLCAFSCTFLTNLARIVTALSSAISNRVEVHFLCVQGILLALTPIPCAFHYVFQSASAAFNLRRRSVHYGSGPEVFPAIFHLRFPAVLLCP